VKVSENQVNPAVKGRTNLFWSKIKIIPRL